MIGIMQGRLTPMESGLIQSFPWKNWQNEIRILKLMNIRKIEWTLDYPDLQKNPLLRNKRSLLNVKKFLSACNIKCNSITCDFFMQKPFFKKKNSYEKKILLKIINHLKNEKMILVIPLVDKSKIINFEEEKKIISFFKKIENKLGNLKIAFETDFNPEKTLSFISNFNKIKFGINYDSGNSAGLGYKISDEFKLYSKRIINVHIKDKIFKKKTVKLGLGDCNFRELFKCLAQIRYNKNIILQTARSKNFDDINYINQNKKFIEKFINDEK